MAQHERSEPVIITSNRSNLGHYEGSAGIGGLLKCVLLCMYCEGTPHVHLSMLNPHLDMDGFLGIIPSEGVVLRAEASYSNVLSFGFGGTIACAALYGSHLMTSRCMAQQDPYWMVLRKLQDAPPQEITITGDDWEDWVVYFPVRHPNPADQWSINIDADGVVNYYGFIGLMQKYKGQEYTLCQKICRKYNVAPEPEIQSPAPAAGGGDLIGAPAAACGDGLFGAPAAGPAAPAGGGGLFGGALSGGGLEHFVDFGGRSRGGGDGGKGDGGGRRGYGPKGDGKGKRGRGRGGRGGRDAPADALDAG
jgi:hypothetical protein